MNTKIKLLTYKTTIYSAYRFHNDRKRFKIFFSPHIIILSYKPVIPKRLEHHFKHFWYDCLDISNLYQFIMLTMFKFKKKTVKKNKFLMPRARTHGPRARSRRYKPLFFFVPPSNFKFLSLKTTLHFRFVY